MSSVEIVQVESGSQLGQFLKYPNTLYANDPNYVAPLLMERKEFLDTDKNPFFRAAKASLFLAMRGKEVVGRIATCVNFAHNDYHEEQVGFFGFFDCPDDYEIARALLKVAMITLKCEGMEKMRGPANCSSNHEWGFLVEGFDSPPVLMMTYNRPYLPRLAEKFGLKKAMDLLAYHMDRETPFSERMTTLVEKLQKRSKISIRSVDLKNLEKELDLVREVYNKAWEYNWGFVPLSEDEFRHVAKDMKQIADPNLVLIAEHGDRPVAFAMGLPDLNQALIHLNGRLLPFGLIKLLWHTKVRNKVKAFRVLTMGVIPEFQKRGVDSMLYLTLYHRAIEHGYQWAEFSWILETNELMRRACEEMGATAYKRYRIVEMPI